MTRPIALIAAVLVALALAACGADSGNEEDSGGGGAGTDAAPTTEAQTDAGGSGVGNTEQQPASTSPGAPSTKGSIRVAMKDIKYVPADVDVKVGQKITWTNNDPVAHTVTARDDSFDSGTKQSGQTYTYTPKKAGKIDYFCEIHPNQVGSINVTQ